MIVKVVSEKQIHLFRIQANLALLKKQCQSAFKTLPKCFQFYYCDKEGDQITVNSQEDINILFESQQPGIKKLFIRQTQIEFQMLDEQPNPEKIEKQNKCLDFGILTANLVKENIQMENNIIKQAVKSYFAETQTQIINKLQQQECQISKLCVQHYLHNLQSKLIDQVILEQQKQIKDQTQRFFYNHLIPQTVNKLENKKVGLKERNMDQNEKKLMKIEQKSINQIVHNENRHFKMEQIQKIVQKKISNILPQLIKKIYKMVELNIQISSSHNHCSSQNCKAIKLTKKQDKMYKQI